MRVLVVEDDPSVRGALERALRGAGHSPETAAEGTRGYELASGGAFDAVVLDLVVVAQEGRRAAVSVKKPRLLFKSWTSSYDWNRNLALTVRAPVADAREFLKSLPRKLRSRSQQWALTLQAGASLVAPHATLNHVHLYVDVPTAILLERFAADLNWPPDPDGRVTLMRPYYRESIWEDVRKHSGIPVVDDLQLALDLWNYPLRGREQAEHILRRSLPWILEDRG